jgi:hypothetical protein
MDKMKVKQPLLYRILGRTVLFLTFFLTSLLLLYVMGNYQNFIDENQNLILSAATITAFLLVFFSASGLFVSTIFFIRKHTVCYRRYVIVFIWMSFAFVYGFIFMFLTHIINFLSQGI